MAGQSELTRRLVAEGCAPRPKPPGRRRGLAFWIVAIAVGLFIVAGAVSAVLGWTDDPIALCGTDCAGADR